MHTTRNQASTKLPIRRKGTKYIVRTLDTPQNSVPVIIAIRDMLNLAKNAKEVQKMINAKLLKINGRTVANWHESIKLFNIFDAGKPYELSLLSTGKFVFNEAKEKNLRLTKVTGKTILPQNTIQLHLHDGSNILSKDKISIGDSLYLDFSNKIKKHLPLEKGTSAICISGRNIGLLGKINEVNGKKALIKFKDREEAIELSITQLVVFE